MAKLTTSKPLPPSPPLTSGSTRPSPMPSRPLPMPSELGRTVGASRTVGAVASAAHAARAVHAVRGVRAAHAVRDTRAVHGAAGVRRGLHAGAIRRTGGDVVCAGRLAAVNQFQHVQHGHFVAGDVILPATGFYERVQGSKREVATQLGLHPNTVCRVWKRALLEWQRSGVYRATSRQPNSGRRRQDHRHAFENLRSTPVARRSTFRAATDACGLSAATLFRELQRGNLRSHSSRC
ncbi:hypothetical protein PHYPSEUDO_006024 [Phytophthora pseudosyringae]|uniref:Uncharacterized protein n=1 Tax=Phytophthora pseudosyringae TaxID=221518 RepID=A0A8T1VKI6_9STRA|nr:hypothetical protein PHYPSEUDO_006024 [Phytophthora pseudosyringae]